MIKFLKKTSKWIFYLLLIPIVYLIFSLILSGITIDRKVKCQALNASVFLSTNGVHLDIIIPKQHLDHQLLLGIKNETPYDYFAFGWGDENFYINTPTWEDLTLNNAFKALFLKSSTLMHVTRFKNKQSNWVEVKISKSELENLNAYISNSFKKDENNMIILLQNKGYTLTDDFYRAKGSYSCFKTCNSWVNTGFKKSGLKSCLWTPFDFTLINKHK